MVRCFLAAWLLAVFAALAAVRAEEVNPLRGSEVVRRPAARSSPTSLRKQLGSAHKQPSSEATAATYLAEEEPATEPNDVVGVPSYPGPTVAPIAAPPAGWTGYESEFPGEPGWHDYLERSHSPHRDPNDPQRHFGIGEPLLTTSWRNRPLYVSLFAGGLIGDELQEGLISQGGGFFAGGRLGGDFDHYWGVESRLAFSDININYAGGTGFGQSRDSFFDASLLYYPWGDSRWRPYFTLGLGVANYRYTTQAGTKISGGALEMPWGGGVKYLLMPNLALRFDLIDNFSFAGGSRLDPMHNVSFTGGIELRFGGRPVSYGSW